MLNRSKHAKIAILGTRGIPARYGGFETAAEMIALGLRRAGYDVIVACEEPDSKTTLPAYEGVRLAYFPVSKRMRFISEAIYDFQSMVKLAGQSDILYMFGYSAGLTFWITKLMRKKLVVNCDGMEWKRRKFNFAFRLLLRLSEFAGLVVADKIVADSTNIANYVRQTYHKEPVYLAYGSKLEQHAPEWKREALEKWRPGLSTTIHPGDYYLILARLEPDNNIQEMINGFLISNTRRKLLVIGPHNSPAFMASLKRTGARDPRVILAGACYDQELKVMLRYYCAAYVHGHMVGGTNPSLLEAIASGNVILATDVPFNREVVGNDPKAPAFFFQPEPKSIALTIETAEPDLDSLRETAKVWGPHRISQAYNWKKIVEGYCSLFEELHEIDYPREVRSTEAATNSFDVN